MTAAAQLRLAQRARLRYDHARDRWLLLGPERGLVLDASALAIVRELAAGRSVSEIASARGDGTASSDVLAFVEDLRRRGWLEPA